MQFFEEMTQQDPPDSSAGDAIMLLKSTLRVTAIASDALQQIDMDLAEVYKIVDGVLQMLAHNRTEEEFEEIYKQAASVGQGR